MFKVLFPIKLQLHVLQLEGYSAKRFLKWLMQNHFLRSLQKKKPLVWTQKAKSIYTLALTYLVLLLFLLTNKYLFLGLFTWFLLFTQPYIFLLLGLITLRPYEYFNRIRVKKLIKAKISKLKKGGLVVIGITGSYGKTTTKNYLYEFLKTKFQVLKTPESYNTLFGIYQVVDLELDEHYDFFICEMGAYKRGEIKELCDVLLPDHGILIGINEQHLERFGSLENTTKAKFELIEALPKNGLKVINGDDPIIKGSYKTYVADPIFYGSASSINSISGIAQKDGRISCRMCLEGKSFELKNLKIIGSGNISNALAASVMASSLCINHASIKKTLEELNPVAHRLEISTKSDGTIVIDDAYSSNVAGFKVALDVLASFGQRYKILVTPGIVELGAATESVHRDLSVLAEKICDYCIFVGDNIRTRSLAQAFPQKKHMFIDSITELAKAIKQLNTQTPVVLIENDLPENY